MISYIPSTQNTEIKHANKPTHSSIRYISLLRHREKSNNSTSRCRIVSWRKSWNIHTSNGNRNNKVVNRHRDPHLQRLFPTTQMMKMKSRWSKFDRILVSVNNLPHREAPTILYYTVSGVKCCMTINNFRLNLFLVKWKIKTLGHIIRYTWYLHQQFFIQSGNISIKIHYEKVLGFKQITKPSGISIKILFVSMVTMDDRNEK